MATKTNSKKTTKTQAQNSTKTKTSKAKKAQPTVKQTEPIQTEQVQNDQVQTEQTQPATDVIQEVGIQPNCSPELNDSEFCQEIGNVVALALDKTRVVEDYMAVLHTIAGSVRDFANSKNINRNFGPVTDSYMSAVGGTTGIPTTHVGIVFHVASILNVTAEVEKATSEHPQRFHFRGSKFNVVILNVVLRYILFIYDKLSRKYIDSLTCTTAEKRERRKIYTTGFVADSVLAIAQELGLTEEAITESNARVAEWMEPKKPAKNKTPKDKAPQKPAEPIEADGFEDLE